MIEQPENTNKTFKEFAYAVSHDLGTPLRAMVEFSRLLKLESPRRLSKDEDMYLSMIVENGEKAQAMLRGLLEYSRLNTVVHPFSMTDCNALLRDCQSELAEKISAEKAALTCEELPTLVADTDQMRRLFAILIDNALTFHPKDAAPQVKVSAAARQGDWLFSVRDKGIGIDHKFHERIFEPFRRLHTDHEYPGIGMGLTLARKVVQHHGGRIWLDSELGKGTNVLFSLPEKAVA